MVSRRSRSLPIQSRVPLGVFRGGPDLDGALVDIVWQLRNRNDDKQKMRRKEVFLYAAWLANVTSPRMLRSKNGVEQKPIGASESWYKYFG
jgi:hypothetical protein